MAMGFPLWLFLFHNVLGVSKRDMYLTKDASGACQTNQLGDPWTSVSPLACFAACTLEYPDTCRSMVYNEANHTCTPGGTAYAAVKTLNASIPDPNNSGGDLLFYEALATPACNTSNGFTLYEACGNTLCLYLSTSGVEYATAESFCAGMNSNLFRADTWARFALFWNVSLNILNQNTWLGLTDRATEGVFAWDDGEPISAELDNIVWLPGQPDNVVNEDCAEVRHRSWPGLFGLNDVPCANADYFICEFNQTG